MKPPNKTSPQWSLQDYQCHS